MKQPDNDYYEEATVGQKTVDNLPKMFERAFEHHNSNLMLFTMQVARTKSGRHHILYFRPHGVKE